METNFSKNMAAMSSEWKLPSVALRLTADQTLHFADLALISLVKKLGNYGRHPSQWGNSPNVILSETSLNAGENE